jgi:hypothetical protein
MLQSIKTQKMPTSFREKMLYTLGVVALRQIDFPAVPASISVLDLNYFYLHGAVPSARRRKKINTVRYI